MSAAPKFLLLIKSEGAFKHSGKYYLHNGRWHKIHQDKPVPKGAPVAAHPHAAGEHQPAKHFTDEQWKQLELPAENVNAGSYNKQLAQLKQMSESGHVTGIVGMGFGTNTYGKKAATVANHLLKLHGSPHQVTPGQKAGEHAAVATSPAPSKDEALQAAVEHLKEDAKQGDLPAGEKAEDQALVEKLEAAQAAPAAPALSMPAFQDGINTVGVKAYYEDVADKIMAMAAAGDVAGLQAMKTKGLQPNKKGKLSNTWAGKTANSKLLLALHHQALQHAQGHAAPAAEPVTAPAAQPSPEPDAHEISLADVKTGALAPTLSKKAFKGDNALWYSQQSGTDIQVAGTMKWEGQSPGEHAQKTLAEYKAAKAAGYSLQYFKVSGLQHAYVFVKDGKVLTQKGMAALPSSAASSTPKPAEPTPQAPPPAPEISSATPEVAPATPDVSAPAASKLSQIPWDAQLLPDSNSNAKSHNGKVAQIKAMAEAGDLAGLEAFKAGKNTYGQKQMKLAAVAIAALKADAQAPAPATEPPGPKDGDTKPAADGGTLVFKGGRWHKQEQAKAAEPAPAIKKLTPKQAIALGAGLKTATGMKQKLKAMAVAGDVAGLEQFIQTHQNLHASKKLAQKMIAAMTGVTEPPAQKPKLSAVPPTPPPQPAPAPTTTPSSTAGVESMDSWKQTGPQGGSNPGGRFMDADGVEWYCKFPGDEDVAKSEVLAAKLYGLAGIAAQDAKLVTKGGKLGIASRWVEVSKGSAEKLAATDGAQSGLAVDAWLANWDVIGLSNDNLQIGSDGKAVRIDAGGSLHYRAQGGKKAFGHTVTEIDSLRDPKINPQAAAVFGGMTKADITASVKKVASISDDDIYDLVMAHGPGTADQRAEMVETLIARKNDLIAKFPKAVKGSEKKKPDPTALKVDTSQLPQPHDFMNWHGPGKGLSSKQHVNESNQKAEQALLESALKGNLIALKDYHFEAIDKESGQSLGMKPIDQHPSQHVKMYWSDLVSTLSYIAYPPEAMKTFKTVYAGTVKKVSDAFKAHKYGVTTNKADANARLAFWIAIGSTKPAESLLPAGASSLEFQSNPSNTPPMTASMKQAAKEAYAKLGSSRLVKRFINGIQSSGSYNDNFRDGKMVTNDGHDAVGMVLDAYEYATEKPEGFEIYKWINFPGQMGKQILQAPPGTVFQNPGSMCCSHDPTGTAGFGHDRIRIRYAKGAKAVDSFGSGNFSSEKEITTLPGQRFVILSSKQVQCPIKGKQRIELDVLMLPPDESYVAELMAQKGQHGKVAA